MGVFLIKAFPVTASVCHNTSKLPITSNQNLFEVVSFNFSKKGENLPEFKIIWKKSPFTIGTQVRISLTN